MVTETFTAGQDFTVPDGVFSPDLELEREGSEEVDASKSNGVIYEFVAREEVRL